MKKSPAAFSLVISCSSRLPEKSLILQETVLLLKGMHFNFSADFFFSPSVSVQTAYIAAGRTDFSAVVPDCFMVAVRYETIQWFISQLTVKCFPNVFLVWFRHLFASFLLHVRHSGRDSWLGLTQ